MRIRRYRELRRLRTFEERYEYLRLGGEVGDITFGHDRWVNQQFYTSTQWRQIRRDVISRDLGLDLGVEGHDIHDKVIIHHMNPMQLQEIVDGESQILDPEFLITVSHDTHNAIHYGDKSLLRKDYVARQPGDTALWGRR